MRRTVLAAVLTAALTIPFLGAAPSVAEDTPVSPRQLQCGDIAYRAVHVRPLARDAWHQRKGATDQQIDQYHSMLVCPVQGTRGRMKHVWLNQKHGYYERRAARKARLANTPYSCGGAIGRSAIPCSIVDCESGGDYYTENDSGAYGKYQLMPEWWAPGYPPPEEQDAIAHDLWAGGAGSGNWVQCL
jgi:hypothetical protein